MSKKISEDFNKKIKYLEAHIQVLQDQNEKLVLQNEHLTKELQDAKNAKKTKSEEEEIDFDTIEPMANMVDEDTCGFTGYKGQLVKACRIYVRNQSFNDFLDEIKKSVIGQDKGLELILSEIYNYVYCIGMKEGKPPKIRTLLAGKSGCGKTQTFRAIKEYFSIHIPELVISSFDASMLTPLGYKGRNCTEMLTPFISKRTLGYGILYMDEFGKRMIPSIAGDGSNVSTEVMNQMLTLLEGAEFNFSKETIDTNLLCIIGGDSFNYVREKKQKQVSRIGFVKTNDETDENEDFITKNDVLTCGATYEILGRFNNLVNYQSLGREQIKHVINKLARDLSNEFDLCFVVTEEYVDALVAMAKGNLGQELGCRFLYSTLYEAGLTAYKEALKQDIRSGTAILIDVHGYEFLG